MKKKEKKKGIRGRLLETRGLTIVDETLLCNRSRGGEGGGGGGGGGGIVLRIFLLYIGMWSNTSG